MLLLALLSSEPQPGTCTVPQPRQLVLQVWHSCLPTIGARRLAYHSTTAQTEVDKSNVLSLAIEKATTSVVNAHASGYVGPVAGAGDVTVTDAKKDTVTTNSGERHINKEAFKSANIEVTQESQLESCSFTSRLQAFSVRCCFGDCQQTTALLTDINTDLVDLACLAGHLHLGCRVPGIRVPGVGNGFQRLQRNSLSLWPLLQLPLIAEHDCEGIPGCPWCP